MNQPQPQRTPRGRGSGNNPPNRFERVHYIPDMDSAVGQAPTEVYLDRTRSILSRNESPDVGFDFSINPYRGCEHGCIYCYARPGHEYLGFSIGLDFETRLMVKQNAAQLLRKKLRSRSWRPQPIALSGVTDPYQPIEKQLRVTRSCLEVLADYRNPFLVITKNQLVVRDADLLGEMAGLNAALVNVSITTLDPRLQRLMEPRASTPQARLTAITRLREAGVPVRVLVAPVIPGLTDHELPAILRAAASAGASLAGFVLLRLPHGVKGLFEEWLEQHFPDRAARVLNRVQETRRGRLNDPNFHTRMKGEGEYAGQIKAMFRLGCQKAGLNRSLPHLSSRHFRVPPSGSGAGQLDLFD